MAPSAGGWGFPPIGNMTQQIGSPPALLVSARLEVDAVPKMIWILLATALLASPAFAQPLGAAEAEELVRVVWFEGLPSDEARRIGPVGATRLAEMLADPEEAAHHANILVALEHCEQPGAFEAIDAWALTPRQGELDRATFRAWQALPFAYGHLAERDPRALARLAQRMGSGPPAWIFRHQGAERLLVLQRRAAASALAMTGLPAAAVHLQGGRSGDPQFEAHLSEMRAVHLQRVGERLR